MKKIIAEYNLIDARAAKTLLISIDLLEPISAEDKLASID